jgi:hypothetical protein
VAGGAELEGSPELGVQATTGSAKKTVTSRDIVAEAQRDT